MDGIPSASFKVREWNSKEILFVCVFKFIFNWRMIALQYCAGFCHTAV